MREMPAICGKCLRYVGKYLVNDLDIWQLADIYGKQLKYVETSLSMCEKTYICGKCLKCLGNGLDMLEMA